MKYYKIINGTTFIGAVTSGQFVAYNEVTDQIMYANETTGQLILYNNIFYRDYWMKGISNDIVSFVQAIVEEISEEEYNILIAAINNNEEIIIDDDDDNEGLIPNPPAEQEPDLILEFTRESKLTETSRACRQAIESGFDLVVRGETHHFSLTTQDQLNLMNLGTLAQTQDLIPYHADGETATFYTAEEINQIIAAATNHKIYQTTYYNALKEYINSLDTIEAIAAITYGTTIPDEYKSDVLKVLEQ